MTSLEISIPNPKRFASEKRSIAIAKHYSVMAGVMEMGRLTTLGLDFRLNWVKHRRRWAPGASPLWVNILRSPITIHEWNGLTKKCKA